MVSPLHGETARKKAVPTGKKKTFSHLKVHCAEIETHTMLTKKKKKEKSVKDLDRSMYPMEYKEKARTLEDSSTLPKNILCLVYLELI